MTLYCKAGAGFYAGRPKADALALDGSELPTEDQAIVQYAA